jgi:RNA polymerase sigma-70 factor (ECF subfamily)
MRQAIGIPANHHHSKNTMLYSFDHQRLSPKAEDIKFTPLSPSDEELMTRVKDEDETAIELLYRRHTPLLRTVIGRVLNNDADVDDLLQEVFLEIWRQAARYSEEKGKALGWIVTLARRRAIDRLRKKMAYSRAQERLHEEVERGPEPAMHHGGDRDLVASDTAKIFRTLIATLPTAQQEALNFAFYRGMSQREIAAHTGIPLGTIKTRLELAIRKVRAGLSAVGGSEEWLEAAA